VRPETQQARSFSTAPRADADSLPYRRVAGHGPSPIGRPRRCRPARTPPCPGTASLTHGRERHQRIGAEASVAASAHARTRRGLACRRHVPGRRHGAITALLSRSTHGTPVPARYGPHGRPDGFFPHRPQVQRYGSSAIRDLQLAPSPACVHGTRTCRTRLDLRQVVVGPGREGDSVVAAGTRACRHGGHEMSAP